MYYKRPSFKRGGPTGIAQLTPNRQRYAGGGNIGGGIISGSNLGTRSGFKYPNFPGFEFLESGLQNELRSQMKPPSGKGLTKGSRGARLISQLRNIPAFGATTAASTLAIPTATVLGLANMNKAKTLEGLNFMKSQNNSGIFDETAMIGVDGEKGDFEKYGEELKKIDAEGETKIGLMDNFFMDEKGRYPNFFGRTKDRNEKAIEEEKIIEDNIDIDMDMRGDPAQFTGEDELTDFDAIVEKVVPNKKIIEEKPEPTFEDTYETEFKRIQKLIGDDNTKGMAAIALSEAIGTPGTIADKAAVLNKSLVGIMGNKKKDKKEIAMLAYKATKEIEKAKIIAGKEGFSEKQFNKMMTLRRTISDTTGTYSKEQKEAAKAQLAELKATLESLSSKSKSGLGSGFSQGLQAVEALDERANKIITYTGDKNSDKYKKMISEYNAALSYLAAANDPSINSGIAQIQARLQKSLSAVNKKDGGRIKFANGTPLEESMQVSETIDTSEVPTAQVSKLSFEELRDRLPPEVTDDVIRFLTQSDQALQDFAYIRTAGDIKKFNMKYGLNLVLPAQQA
tara:strand:- start:84 stop:1781 length:1698 start_codon:yes stop_codon:yes gene_type:complete